jgi:hypothetical protein
MGKERKDKEGGKAGGGSTWGEGIGTKEGKGKEGGREAKGRVEGGEGLSAP